MAAISACSAGHAFNENGQHHRFNVCLMAKPQRESANLIQVSGFIYISETTVPDGLSPRSASIAGGSLPFSVKGKVVLVSAT